MNTILSEAKYRAVAGKSQSFGITPQDTLSDLMQLAIIEDALPIVILPRNLGDAFFSQAQIDWLQELKSKRNVLTTEERTELATLIESAFDATIARTQALPLVSV